MSFVNLMGNDIWSDADITRRTEAIIRSQFSEDEERILNRKITGALLGKYTLSEVEEQELINFQTIVFLAQQEGVNASNDMILLNKVFPVEQAYLRLTRAEIEPILEENVIINQEEIDNDIQERLVAQEIVDDAEEEVLNLVHQRNPVEVIEEPVIVEEEDVISTEPPLPL